MMGLTLQMQTVAAKQVAMMTAGWAIHLLLAIALCLPLANALAEEELLTISLVDKGTDVFYLPATIGGDATELLLDTGSGYLALNSRIIKSLENKGLAAYSRSIRARLATGSISNVRIYTISSLDLGPGCTMHNVEAAMLGSNSRNILGMNVLKRVDNVSLSLTTATLTLSGCASEGNHLIASNP